MNARQRRAEARAIVQELLKRNLLNCTLERFKIIEKLHNEAKSARSRAIYSARLKAMTRLNNELISKAIEAQKRTEREIYRQMQTEQTPLGHGRNRGTLNAFFEREERENRNG